MGILDNKTRLLDTIITQEGRRQLASGKMKIEFVSFSDAEVFYQGDIVSGSGDASDRLYLEACDLPQDQITFEADDSGKLVPYKGSQLGVIDGKVLSGASDVYLHVVTGSVFSSVANDLLDSSIENFSKLFALRTDDAFNDDEREFKTSTNVLEFVITEKSPLGSKEIKTVDVEHVESLFQDKRLSHLPNFRYLPPVNRATSAGSSTTPLGDYPVIGQRKTPMTYAQLKNDLRGKDFRIIEFNSNSMRSNLVCQMFEVKQDKLSKLDIIDFGDIITDEAQFAEKRVFFIGKVFIDNFGTQTFVNMFTIIFE